MLSHVVGWHTCNYSKVTFISGKDYFTCIFEDQTNKQTYRTFEHSSQPYFWGPKGQQQLK